MNAQWIIQLNLAEAGKGIAWISCAAWYLLTVSAAPQLTGSIIPQSLPLDLFESRSPTEEIHITPNSIQAIRDLDFRRIKMPNEQSPLLKDAESQRLRHLGVAKLLAGLFDIGSFVPCLMLMRRLRADLSFFLCRRFPRQCRQIYSVDDSKQDCVFATGFFWGATVVGIIQSRFLRCTTSCELSF